jgi:tRNA nucleotidyltransferase (CCA-adding enzyme)
VVGLAVLCHDLGKPATTKQELGRITSKGHEQLGEQLTRKLLERMTREQDLLDEVPPLVGAHLAPVQLHTAGAGDGAVRRLARRVGRIDRLVRVARADQLGRPPRVSGDFAAGDWLLERARALDVEAAAPVPLVLGRHLIELGLEPGPRFGPILEACYSAQIEGAFSTLEEAVAFAKGEVDRHGA